MIRIVANLLGFYSNGFRTHFFSFGQINGQDAIYEISLGFIGYNIGRYHDGPFERAPTLLADMISFLLGFLFIFDLAFESEHFVGNRDLDIIGLNSWQRSLDDDLIIILVHVYSWVLPVPARR